jgi:hypothetical protein
LTLNNVKKGVRLASDCGTFPYLKGAGLPGYGKETRKDNAEAGKGAIGEYDLKSE